MPQHKRSLRIAFDSAQAFQREFDSNLCNGGAFIRTDEAFELRESVGVELAFAFSGQSLELDAEIVHIVPAGMGGVGASAGVAVQFALPVHDLRARFDALHLDAGARKVEGGGGARGARRTPVRVAARIQGDRQVVEGRTRNLSLTGVLVATDGHALPLGESVSLRLAHPTTGEERSLRGQVVRQVESEGQVNAVALHFTYDDAEREDLQRFIESVQGAESTRRLGGISGPIEELGPQSLLQMFATSAPAGTLVLRRDQEEGVICFEGGLIRLAQLGGITGMKALIRLLSWRDGVFEFHARAEARETGDAPLPLEAALLDALRQMDEGTLIDHRRFPLHAHVALVTGGDVSAHGDLSKVESAVLDLAQVGFTVQRMLDVIPEPDPEIFRALDALTDAGLVRLET